MSSMLARVQRGTVLSACIAAAFAAGTTSVLAGWFVQRAEDRRLKDAAVVLADELGDHASLQEAVDDELHETSHMGLVFAVFDGAKLVAGDARLPALSADHCDTTFELRSCATSSSKGLTVVAAGSHASTAGWFFLAALVSMLIAALVALLATRPLAAALVAPLTRLRGQLTRLDASVDLGDRENVEEVDQLRDTLKALLQRLHVALEQAERFSANAAHELRTPLTSIRAQLELLDEEPDKTAATLSSMRQTASRLEVMVERLLVLATPIGVPEPALETLSLRDALEDVIVDDRVTIEIVDDVFVKADAMLVHSMLSNAINNALRFGSKVTARLSRDGEYARVIIVDDGPGIPDPERERVFEPFQRLHPGGHGLGLALIAHVARRYGGTARFLPSPRGARLELTLRSSA